MKNYKAYYIISAFIDEELDLFESFLKSPYHNTRRKPVELFQIIKKNKNKSELSKQKVFEKLYPGKKFNSNTFNDLMAQLHKLAEEFLIAETSKKDKVINNLLLMDKFLEGRFKDLFEGKKRQVNNLMETEKIDGLFFVDSYIKEGITLNFLQTYKDIKTKKDKKEIVKLLYACIANIINFALEETITIFVQAETRRNELIDNKIRDLISEITLRMFDQKFLDLLKPYNKYHFNVDLLKKLLNTFIHREDIEVYYEYKKAVKKYRPVLSQDNITFHYTYLMGYVQSRLSVNVNDKVFIREINLIYKDILKNKYYTSVKVNFFRPKLYGNFLNIFLEQKNTAAIRHMIDNCIPLLEKRFIPFYKNLSLSYISYLSGDYNAALELIKNVNIHFIGNLHKLKMYIIKLHFLLGETEQTLNLTDSYIKYLNSNEKSDKQSYLGRLNYVKNVRKIVIAKNRRDSEELKYLLKQISDEPIIKYRDWLIKTLEKIIKEN